MKTIKWNTKAKEFVRDLDQSTRREIGALLLLLQRGQTLGMPQSKPMRSIHQSAYELRVKDRQGAYRIIYVLNLGEHILIQHAFTKKTEKTPEREIEVSRKRIKELINENQ